MMEFIKNLAVVAGKEILKVYDTGDLQVETKVDNSPVTIADKIAHEIICEALEKEYSIPVLSEEGVVDEQERLSWDAFWLVDPLDGTKDFIKKTGMFTVNIALIENKRSTMGAVYAPVGELLYSAEKDKGAYLNNQLIQNTRVNKDKLISANSVFHSTDKMDQFFSNNQIAEVRKIGSSLKFGRFAEGEIDVYPRLAPTCEWDTAAGQIVAEEAGGLVLNLETMQPLTYQKQSLINPHFILTRSDLTWKF